MKVALLHDYLNQYGGGERVLEVLMEMFPEAPVFTLMYDAQKTLGRFEGRVGGASFLNFPFARNHHRLFIPLMPLAAQTMMLDDYDLVISDTAGFAKGIGYGKNVKHISYIHTPLRYAWEVDNYFTNPLFKTVFRPAFWYLRRWDYRAGQKPNMLLVNSQFIADKVKNYYDREAQVIYPPVDVSKFYFETSEKRKAKSEKEYYLAVGRLLHYKRFDLIIDAFAKLGLPLKIVGTGPEFNKLKAKSEKLKARSIEFVQFVKDDNELRQIYSGAKAFIFPQVEDFGLTAAEAQACGTPVIAYRAGGAMEIVEEGANGIFFDEQTPESLISAVRRFEKMFTEGRSVSGGNFDRKKISESAQRFSKENFKTKFSEVLKNIAF